jgi:hypothetical protein
MTGGVQLQKMLIWLDVVGQARRTLLILGWLIQGQGVVGRLDDGRGDDFDGRWWWRGRRLRLGDHRNLKEI